MCMETITQIHIFILNSKIFFRTSRNAEHEVAGMQDHSQEEISAKENLARSLNKALGEADMLRVRYEKEGVAKAEELEMAKLKMQVCQSRCISLLSKLHFSS